MTERLNLIITLELAIARSSAERRTQMVLQLADLFIRDSARFAEDKITLFDETITRIAAELDVSVLAMLAQRFAPIANAPINIVRMLANNHDIKVAYPILAHSQRLDEGTLLYNARTKSQQHLLAISWRKSLSEVLTELLLERGNRQIVLNIIKNPGAKISDAAFRLLVQHLGSDDVSATLLGSRPDILTLLTRAPEAIRNKLIAENQYIAHEIDRVFTMFADRLLDRAAEPTNEGSVQGLQAETSQNGDGAFQSVGENNSEETGPVEVLPEVCLAEPKKAERRQTGRQKSFLRGYVYFNNRRSSVECLIRDMSDTGARILISQGVTIPNILELYIPLKEQTLRATVEWRRDDEIGLAYLQATRAPSEGLPANQLTQRVSQLELEIASLRGVIKRANSNKVTSANDSDAA